jgi:hypothetical protein
MAKLSKDLSVGALHPREAIFATGTLAANGAEVVIDCDGSATVSLDMRGTFSLTLEVSGTIDGTNWTVIPMKPVNQASKLYLLSIVGTVQGSWVGSCAGFRKVRARVTAFTSGAALTYLAASTTLLDQSIDGKITANAVTAVGASGAAQTLTIANPGTGLRPYLTYVAVNRFAAAVLTAAATPVTVTTTNLPGSLAFTFPADALTLGQMDRRREDFSYPIAASAQGTATTIVAPATTGVIWRLTAGFYVAP